MSLTKVPLEMQTGSAPIPSSTDGAVGNWKLLSFADNTAVVLPAGGNWSYFLLQFATSGNTVTFAAAGIAAGGATLFAAQSGKYWYGFCYRAN